MRNNADPLRVGIFLGTDDDYVPNIDAVLGGYQEALTRFNVETFGGLSPSEELQNAFTHVNVPSGGYRTPFGKQIAIYRQTVEYVRRRDPDVLVQMWKFNTHAAGVTAGAERTGTPVVVRLASDAFNAYTGPGYTGPAAVGVYVLNNVVGRLPMRRADRVIALGPYGRDQACARGASERAVSVLPPPLSMVDEFEPPADATAIRSELGLPEAGDIALFVGRLTEQKGMAFLRPVIESLAGVTFVLVGEGPFRDVFADRYDNVLTPGRVTHERIHEYYQATDVYVHPSPLEGFPLVVLEAISCGTPVLARDAGDIGFVTEDVVDTPEEMVNHLRAKTYSYQWQNKEYFEPPYQNGTLHRTIGEAAQSG